MAAGKPCIATAWGASLAFLNDGNAWLAAPRQLVPVGDAACRENLYLSPEHRWADPDPAQVSELLRRAASNVVERLTKGQQALQDAVSRWTPRHTAAAIAERIEALRSDRPRPLAPPNKTVLAVSGGRLSSSLEKVAAGLRTTSVAKRPSAVAPAPVVPAPSTATTDSVLSVRWEGSQFVHHSLAHVNRALCLRLAKMGHDLSIRPFEPDQFGPGDDPDLSILTKLHNAPLEGPCQVHVRQTWPPNLEAPAQGKWVVIQPWEFGSPPVDWIAPFRDQVDEIWAYTECVKRVYVEAGIPESQVRVVPLGVDTESFRPGLKPLPGLERDGRLTFLYVGGTIARKGFDVLLNAWRQAFGPSDNVRLVVKAMGGDTFYKGQTGEAMVREINASGKSAPVVYFDQDLSPVNLPRIYASGDVLVHPYRGEGFGLPIAEAMASGLPVVVTRGGASDDFCGENESWGISAKRVPVPGGKVGPFETVVPPWWLEPSVEELAETLRKIAKDEAGRKAKGEAARRRILSGWTWDHAARAAESALREIAAKPVARRDGGKSSDVPNAQLNASDEAALTGLNKILFRAEAAAARGEMGEAESATREAVQAHPDQPLAWLARAMILRGLKKFPAASESVLKSIALKESPEALLESVLIHRLCGQDARAKVAEKTLKGSHSAWLAATRALYNAKGQSWPLDSPAKAVKKSVAPPLKGRR
jgi:glycosyltransferase involved in cell wall biosynthesis